MNEKELIQAAQNGDVAAILELAEYYEKESGGFKDKVSDVMTIEYFNEMMQAQDDDDDQSKDESESLAYKYYRMAAEAGNAKAMTETARRLYDGIGVDKNENESDEWYRRGAEAGDPSAMRVVAFRSKSDEERFKYFKLSAELLEPSLNKKDSIKQTAINYACGRGTEKDIAQVEEWLAKLNQNDAGSAMREIAQITGDNSWLERAGEFDPMAMVRMAEDFTLKDDFVNALKCYEKALTNSTNDTFILYSSILSIIGDIYYIGENGIEQDYEKAFEYLPLQNFNEVQERKCENGNKM